MAFKLYFSPALLLLVLTCPLWEVGLSVPLSSQETMTDSCVSKALILLRHISETLKQNNLSIGIDCTWQSVEMNTETDTLSVCSPENSNCTGPVRTEFNQDLCLKNIKEDLQYYHTFLSTQPDSISLPIRQILLSLRDLMTDCFKMPLHTDLSSAEAAVDHQSLFDKKLTLCKVLKGFHIRTITINRVISYMHSGEHTK